GPLPLPLHRAQSVRGRAVPVTAKEAKVRNSEELRKRETIFAAKARKSERANVDSMEEEDPSALPRLSMSIPFALSLFRSFVQNAVSRLRFFSRFRRSSGRSGRSHPCQSN